MTGPIREWARSQGIEVGARGLIPRHIIEAYKQANGIPSTPTGYPAMPPKPRITQWGGAWLLDNGSVAILHDSWAEAIASAGRICGDYRDRVAQWLAEPPC